MKFIHVLPLLAAAALFAFPRISYAQFCVPGTPICAGKDGITVTGPAVNPGANAGASAQGNAGGGAQGQGAVPVPTGTVTPPKVDYTAQWQAYAAWRAQIQAAARARVRAQVEAELAENLRRTLPNPYIGRPLTPRYEGGDGGGFGGEGGAVAYGPYERQPTVGILGLVVGNLSGRRSPSYLGYALPIRVPVGENFRLATDLSLLALFTAGPTPAAASRPGNSQVPPDTSSTFGAFQVRPALLGDFAHDRNGSYAYWRAGAHLTTPLGGGANSPDFFYGPSAGVGLHRSLGAIGFGAEWNVDGWAAVGSKKDPDYARFRVGTDVRAWLVFNY